jgi:hypothetical protein
MLVLMLVIVCVCWSAACLVFFVGAWWDMAVGDGVSS